MNWFNILKESRQVSDTETNLNIITEPLGDADDCCDKAIDSLEDFILHYNSRGEINKRNPPAVKGHAKTWFTEFIKILKDSGSYNTWTLQEGLPNNAGGITEEGCEQFYNMLKRRLSPFWYDSYVKLSPRFRDMYEDGKKILDNWDACKNE